MAFAWKFVPIVLFAEHVVIIRYLFYTHIPFQKLNEIRPYFPMSSWTHRISLVMYGAGKLNFPALQKNTWFT